LAEALLGYQGTVIFTSHDRHFMKRVATCIVEVRDSRVVNYRGDYEAYLYAVNKEIEQGERERESRATRPAAPARPPAAPSRPSPKNERAARKEIANLERSIAQLDAQKREAHGLLMQTTDPAEALRLHNEVESLASQIATAEDRWGQLQEQVATD
jgi:ATP-binding cassette subfamily F protein 3